MQQSLLLHVSLLAGLKLVEAQLLLLDSLLLFDVFINLLLNQLFLLLQLQQLRIHAQRTVKTLSSVLRLLLLLRHLPRTQQCRDQLHTKILLLLHVLSLQLLHPLLQYVHLCCMSEDNVNQYNCWNHV